MGKRVTEGGVWDQKQRGAGSSVPDCSISVPVATLQSWALELSQGCISPRWEIEKLLTDNEVPIRDPSV